MENAKRTYEILNSELHDELPALHDSRILFLVTNMQTLFAAEEVFHSETSKVGQSSQPDLVTFLDICSCFFKASSCSCSSLGEAARAITCQSITARWRKQKQECLVLLLLSLAQRSLPVSKHHIHHMFAHYLNLHLLTFLCTCQICQLLLQIRLVDIFYCN